IEELTRDELEERLKGDPVIVLPVGATEAHGPHLPTGTDSLQPEHVADRLAERLNGLVAPPIRYGHHSSTKNMVGTLAIGSDTLRSLVGDVLISLARNGATRVVVLSGHAGSVHMAALKVACEEAVRGLDLKVMLLTDYELASELSEDLGIPAGDSHGGLVETSRVMSIAPHLVKGERKKGTFVDQEYMILPNPEVCFPQGFAGRADLATVETGDRLNRHVVDRLEGIVRRRMA
ncbi:MAG: creatininase family protein, partial [Thermoplasmatota archaeon]